MYTIIVYLLYYVYTHIYMYAYTQASLVAQRWRICLQCRRHGFDSWVGKIPWGRHGNPLQSSCLENPMDRRAWRAAVHSVTQSRTRLKWLSSSSVYIWHLTHTSDIFIHSSVDGYLGCFRVLAIVNSAAMNVGVHLSLLNCGFSRYMPRSGIACSYGSSIFNF